MTDPTERFQAALGFATEMHRHQRRKGTSIPYVSHLLGVTPIALEIGADEDQAIAALLHEAVEDPCSGLATASMPPLLCGVGQWQNREGLRQRDLGYRLT
jgi:hypothetical protein